MWNETRFGFGAKAFIAMISTWYLLTGFGIILRKPWGYYLLKSVLYALYVGWPLGTMLAKWVLEYITKNEIKVFFFNKVMEV